jgi:hypothetical protein
MLSGMWFVCVCLQELQQMSQQAISSEVALQQMRNDMQQLNTGQQQLATRLEVWWLAGVQRRYSIWAQAETICAC